MKTIDTTLRYSALLEVIDKNDFDVRPSTFGWIFNANLNYLRGVVGIWCMCALENLVLVMVIIFWGVGTADFGI